jgi:DNA-directed RNA polymerase sigma subunit (sigma70/sigma32)
MGTGNTVRHLGEGEERRLLRRLISGDLDARRRLIEAHLGMVTALGRRYAGRITTTPIGG